MSELRGGHYEDGDEPDSTADVPEEDELHSSPDEPDSEIFSEDEEPLTRGEYADEMHEQAAAEEQDSDDRGEPEEPADELAEPAETPEPRTRQEVADENEQADAGDADARAENQDRGTDLDAVVAEEDRLAEPRTRQETSDEATAAATSSPGDAVEASSDDLARRESSEPGTIDEPSAEEQARLHAAYQDYLKEYGQEAGSGWEQGSNTVGEKPDRSPGDTSDLPPTGTELLDMDNDNLSRFEKLRKETYKEIDDIFDVTEKDGGTLKDLFDRPPTANHTEIPTGHPVIDQTPTSGVDSGHVVTAGLVVGIIGLETARAISHIGEKWRGKRHDGNR
jgi:hypothetical protein